jgi:hypothetical protein
VRAAAAAIAGLCLSSAACSAKKAPIPIGVNLMVVTAGAEEIPFVDVFKLSSPWTPVASRGSGPPLALDKDGWITALAPGQAARATIFGGTSGHYPGGDYTLLYEGVGALDAVGPGAAVIARAPGRLTVRVTPRGGPDGGITLIERATDRSRPIRNIRMILPGFEGTYAQDPFYPPFIERLRPFGAIRFMPWEAVNRSEVAEWADRRAPTFETQALASCCEAHAISGVALEYQIDLANRLGADPWFNAPARASDDYFRQMARLVHARLRPGLHPHIEYGNELWNPYFKTDRAYIEAAGQARGLSNDPHTAGTYFYVQRSARMFQIWDEVFGEDKGRIVRVIESQEGDPRVDDIELAYLRNLGAKADALAVGAYVAPPALMDWRPVGADYYEAILRLTPAQVIQAMADDIQQRIRPLFKAHAERARRYGVDLLAYEGGQGLQVIAADPELRKRYGPRISALFAAANREPGMARVYRELFDAWSDVGGGLFMTFGDVAAPGAFGDWGLLEYQNQDPATAVKYKAVTDYIAGRDPGDQSKPAPGR